MSKQNNIQTLDARPTQVKPYFLRRVIKKCWMPLAIFVITLAIVFSLFRALTPWAKQYKTEVEQHLSTMLGQPVTINDMETSWYWFVPVLKLNDVTISDGQDHVLQLKKLLVGINLFSSLWHWQIQPGILYVEDAVLTIHQIDDRWEIDGLAQEQKKMTLEKSAYAPVLGWLLEQQKIVIKHVSADVYLSDGSFIPLKNIHLTIVNHHGHYRVKGSAYLAQKISTQMSVIADIQLNLSALQKTKGHVYVGLRQFIPMQWQTFLPKLPCDIKDTRGDLRLWLDFTQGKIAGLQSEFSFQNIRWRNGKSSKEQSIQSLQANVSWTRALNGWTLAGDQIKAKINGLVWPENTVQIKYQNDTQTYQVFAKTLLIAPILNMDMPWPDSLKPVLIHHPSGELYDTQVKIAHGSVSEILTRFSNLSWKKYQTTPGIKHISGVLSWHPTKGRLDLNGEQVIFVAKNKPKITLDQLNGSVDWQLGDVLNVNVNRLIMVHPSFLLNAQAALKDHTQDKPGLLDLSLEFSLNKAHQWMSWIPEQALKPKLYYWLTHDVKNIDKATGKVVINGPLSNFPFDHQEGEFTVSSYLTGLDLRFAKHWPIATNVDAYLQVKERTLDANIVHANFGRVESGRVALQVNNLGLNKERLLVRGLIDAPARDMQDYIWGSPLKFQLKKLNTLVIKNHLNLDLSLDVPLFPEDDKILVHGKLGFNNNQIGFKKVSHALRLKDLTGTLNFDEDGVNNSQLTGVFLNEPVNIEVNQPKQNHYTKISFDTYASIPNIQQQLNLPKQSWLDGRVRVKTILALTNDPKLTDYIHASSSLAGVSIGLPPPFGKDLKEKAPLNLYIHFAAQDGFRLQLNYDNRLSTDLWLNDIGDQYVVDRGEVRLGSGRAQLNKQPNVQVVGALTEFNWQQWHALLGDSSNKPSFVDKLQFVDIQVGHLIAFRQDFKDVTVSFHKENNHLFALQFKQKDMSGHVHFDVLSRTLSGNFDYLLLNDSLFNDKKREEASTLVPKDIPNLDISIQDFQWGKKQFGRVILKSKSTDSLWKIEQLDVSTPAYQLQIDGEWMRNEKTNQTKMHAKLDIKDLAKGLERMQISPVVGARQGSVEFEGGWKGGIADFALANVQGQFQMQLKNGRITHFSPETEQKLGLGKLLSVLSLQTIPRRLKLDFSDLAYNGYSFDIFKGSFAMNHGVLRTHDSYLDGPVAYASMKGDLDVSKRLYDLNLLVSPNITASLPVVATIAGGPIAGVATWVVSRIINDRMQKVSGYTYKISGPWLDPVIEQVSIHKKAPFSVPQRD